MASVSPLPSCYCVMHAEELTADFVLSHIFFDSIDGLLAGAGLAIPECGLDGWYVCHGDEYIPKEVVGVILIVLLIMQGNKTRYELPDNCELRLGWVIRHGFCKRYLLPCGEDLGPRLVTIIPLF